MYSLEPSGKPLSEFIAMPLVSVEHGEYVWLELELKRLSSYVLQARKPRLHKCVYVNREIWWHAFP